MASDFHENIGKRKAIIPQRHHLAGPLDDARIDQGYSLVDMYHCDSLCDPYLGSCNSSAEPVRSAKISQRVEQISDGFLQPCVRKFFHLLALYPEQRIAEKKNFPNSHGLIQRRLNILAIDTIEQFQHC